MSQLSAVIITYNEQDFIGRCLTSLKGVADEIIVVDSYSSDATADICKTFNVKLIRHAFEGYIEQKSWALSQASNKWILSLDADEALSDELRKSILEVKENLQYDGYYFNRRNNYCGKWLKYSECYPDRQLRLFNSGKGRWAGMNPHDKFIMNKESRTCNLNGDLLHWNYGSFKEHIEKMERFSSIGAAAYFKAGRSAGPFTALFHAAWCFLRSYILRAGFFDGYYGYKMCSISSNGCYLKYSKLRKLCFEEERNKIPEK